MDDKELLDLAAKAAGKKKHPISDAWYAGDMMETINDGTITYEVPMIWNPLTDDGDALRLAVKLGINIRPDIQTTGAHPATSVNAFRHPVFVEFHDGDPNAATRRAIVLAAAEIGKGMK